MSGEGFLFGLQMVTFSLCAHQPFLRAYAWDGGGDREGGRERGEREGGKEEGKEGGRREHAVLCVFFQGH